MRGAAHDQQRHDVTKPETPPNARRVIAAIPDHIVRPDIDRVPDDRRRERPPSLAICVNCRHCSPSGNWYWPCSPGAATGPHDELMSTNS